MPLLVMRSYPDTLLDESAGWRCGASATTGRSGRCRGGSRSPPTTSSITPATTSTWRLRRPRAGHEARPRRRAGGRAVRVRAAVPADPTAAAANSPPRGGGLLGGTASSTDRLHAAPKRSSTGACRSVRAARPDGAIVSTYLAHHQGMTLAAISAHRQPDGGALPLGPARAGDGAAPPGARAAPRAAAAPSPGRGGGASRRRCCRCGRHRRPLHTAFPHAQFLSNGNYTVVVTNAGGGELLPRAYRHAVAAGRDPRPWGQYVYLRDVRASRSGPRRISRREGTRTSTSRSRWGRRRSSGGTGEIGTARRRGLPRGRRRGAPARGDEPRRSRPRARRDELRRDRPRAAGRRPRSPRLRQALRGVGVRPRVNALLCGGARAPRRTPRCSPSTSSARRAGRRGP